MAIRNIGERLKIFIGSEPKTEIARKVLECSIQRHTEMTVEFIPMIGRQWEYSKKDIRVGTGFSLRRWMIPAFCNWEGRAIYMDADQLVLSDVWDLWTMPDQMPHLDRRCSAWMTYQKDKFCSAPWPQSSVMSIDCERAKAQWGWHLDKVLPYLRENTSVAAYADFMHCTWMTPQPQKIATEWNHLDTYKQGSTKLIHYTKEDTQPWYDPKHPLALQWKMELSVAVTVGLVTQLDIKDALSKYGVQEDWRKSNGLHPDYARFIDNRKVRKRMSE